MRVLVIGAGGLIGSYVAARFVGEGHDVVGVGRDLAVARRLAPRITWVRADLAATTAAAWTPHVAGIDAVVNCAGALQDGPRDDLAAVHVDGLVTLVQA